MRDIIWTVIVLWFIWKIVDAVRSISANRTAKGNSGQNHGSHSGGGQTNSYSSAGSNAKKGELRPDAGEYIDYEEVK